MSVIIFPTGRLVGGSLDKLFPRTDNFGKPKMKADGTPSLETKIGFAIRKGVETHWNQTPWGAQVYEIGKAAYPREHVVPSFAWKIADGDSTVPNKKGNINANNENYRGCWVIWFSQSWLPKLCNADGSAELPHGSIKIGYFVKVMAEVLGNAPAPSPGVYLNPSAVALVAEGDEIASEVDTAAFAATATDPLPPGARPVTAAVPGFAAAAPAPAAAAPYVAPAPDARFLAVPPPVAAAPPPVRRMTPAAQGVPYEAYVEKGWTDALLIQHGMMLP